ncbi:MAG: sodium transporter [Cyanobacteria bacterium SW_10_48_33]|nr:MAG: sodium transporter [Cyanobacteria bacterium SW_10_48_33]PSP24371.1 MAG: sodium transporter [Cyanobacteria bacterium SW_8_48_13]
MTAIDLVFLVAYFIAVGGIGYWSSKYSQKNSRAYFLGGSSIGWMPIGASLFASNISAEHLIGLAGSGASSGLAVGQFEWIACFMLLLLGWLFAPFYVRSGVFTMPEFIEKRFNSESRKYLSAISLVAYIFTKISVAVFAGALVLETVLGWNIWVGAIFLVVATGIYTIFGGLRAVIFTDFMQSFVLIGGGIALTAIAISQLGGLGAMFEQTNPGKFNLWKPATHPEYPWIGILLGTPIIGIWYWCTDQQNVQRTLAAEDLERARAATIYAGFLKLLPIFIFVLPGVVGGLLFPDAPTMELYPRMLNELLPPGIKGLVVAGVLAALMSSLSSVFNSSSTLAVIDFYKEGRPNASERELVVAGQIATVILVLISLLWLPLINVMSNQLYVYIQSVQAYIAPPITVVFLVGIFWKRASGKAAFITLISGFILGAVRLVVELAVKAKWITWKPLVIYGSINYLYFAILLFIISILILVFVSLRTAAPSQRKLSMFRASEEELNKYAGSSQERKRNVFLSVFLSVIVLAFWLIFSPIIFSSS